MRDYGEDYFGAICPVCGREMRIGHFPAMKKAFGEVPPIWFWYCTDDGCEYNDRDVANCELTQDDVDFLPRQLWEDVTYDRETAEMMRERDMLLQKMIEECSI